MGTLASAAAGAGGGRAGLRIRGTVAAGVQHDTRQVSGAPVRALMIIGVIAAFVALAAVLLFVFAYLVIIAIVLGFAVALFTGHGAFGPLRWLFDSGSRMSRAPRMPGSVGPSTIDITRFRVVDGNGAPHDCELIGTLRAPPPRLNDHVEVVGRRRRDGVVLVRKLHNTVTRTTVRGRVPGGAIAARVAAVIIVVALVFAVVVVAQHMG